MLNNKEVTTRDKAAMKKGMLQQAGDFEKIAAAAESAAVTDRSAASSMLQAAEGNMNYAASCRQAARNLRELAKEL